MSRLVDYLIEDVRSHTENEEFSDTIGIKDNEFLRFLNDAQYRIHSLIIQQHPSAFQVESSDINIVANQESYTLPIDVHLGNKLSLVEYSPTSNTSDYRRLYRKSLYQRRPGSEGDPRDYIRKSGKIMLSPIPNTANGLLRYTYVQSVPRLAKRRGSVSSVTLDSSTNSISALSLNVSTDTVDTDTLDKFTRVCIVDSEGSIKMKNIQIDSVDGSTGTVTVNSSFNYETGETIAVGDYIVEGKYSTTHTTLDDMVERYLIAYCNMKIFHRDSSADITSQAEILTNMENEIVAAYADIEDDIYEIPIIISEDDEWV